MTTTEAVAPASLARPPKAINLDKLENDVQTVYEKTVLPLADRFVFKIDRPKTTAGGMPTVLLLGNHSSGKSTFINYLFGSEIQMTGVAPTDDGFTLIRHNDTETDIDGKALVTHTEFPYTNLKQYGPVFCDHLKLKLRRSDVLKNLILIDSPGMIDSANGARTRGYDFISVVRHFAENADLIIFFFDPDKPGTTGESLTVFTESLSSVAHKLLIVMNKVDSFQNIRDFARAYGALCWNLAHVIQTKDLPHIYCTYIETKTLKPTDSHVPLEDFKLARDEVVSEITRAPERRADNLVTTLYSTARRLQAHVRVASSIARQHRFWTAIHWLVILVVLGTAGAFAVQPWKAQNYSTFAQIAGVGILVAAVVYWAGLLIIRHLYQGLIAGVDYQFRKIYDKEWMAQTDTSDLKALWESVKPDLVRYLQRTKPNKIPSGLLHSGKFSALNQAITGDILKLRRSVLGA